MRFHQAMIIAIDLAVADVPWWVLILVVLALLGAFWRWWVMAADIDDETSEAGGRLAIPLYVERDGLRNLVSSVKVELPHAREVTKQRKLNFKWKDVGGERSESETKQFKDEIDLGRLARNLDAKLDYEACSRDLGDAPNIEGREILTEAVARLEGTVGDTSPTRELLGQVEQVYEQEHAELIVKQKRDEFADAAKREKLLLLSGKFETAVPPGDGRALLVLTHFEPPPAFADFYGRSSKEPDPVPVPQGVGIRVALPDDGAFTPAGKERLTRGEPFFARAIAHSPSFNTETGMLTCAAFALWGTNRRGASPTGAALTQAGPASCRRRSSA